MENRRYTTNSLNIWFLAGSGKHSLILADFFRELGAVSLGINSRSPNRYLSSSKHRFSCMLVLYVIYILSYIFAIDSVTLFFRNRCMIVLLMFFCLHSCATQISNSYSFYSQLSLSAYLDDPLLKIVIFLFKMALMSESAFPSVWKMAIWVISMNFGTHKYIKPNRDLLVCFMEVSGSFSDFWKATRKLAIT